MGLKANLERKGCGHRVRPETGIKNRERNKESLCSYSSKPISISLLFFFNITNRNLDNGIRGYPFYSLFLEFMDLCVRNFYT